MNTRIFTDEKRFWGEDDSQTIQNAIDYAEANGIEEVVIPRHNPHTDSDIWMIDRAILLPSNLTVILADAHLKLAVGVRSNVFCNRNAWTPLGKTLEGEQYGIRILGEGRAVIDGGFPNGLCEQLRRSRPDLYPHICVNLLLFLHNVRDFEVRGIRFVESRWWATCFMFCRNGRIADLDFRMYGNLENQDGIDLRIGCEYITVENITGITGDDTVAMTAYPNWEGFEKDLWVEGKSFDIHDITVRNIVSSTHGCSLVRMLNCDGAKEYNITVSDLVDTGNSISGCGVIIGVGSDTFAPIRNHTAEEFYNITVRNVRTCAQEALQICEPCRDLLIENVTTFGPALIGMTFSQNFKAENVTIRNFTLGTGEEPADSLMTARCTSENMKDLHVEKVQVGKVGAIWRGVKKEIAELQVLEQPVEGEFTEEISQLPHPYGRYHRYFHDQLMSVRSKDSRWYGENYDI